VITFITVATLLAIVGTRFAHTAAHAAPAQQAPAFDGVWASTLCEPQPGGPFAKRLLTISGGAFVLEVTSFLDGQCIGPRLKTQLEGAFRVRAPSPTVPGAWDVEFTIRRAALTPYVTNMAEFLNSAQPGTCGVNTWSVGTEQDLAATHGCQLIGLDLRRPLVEYDIAKVEQNFLFLGQRPADGGFLNTPARRPTQFGPPLLRQPEAPTTPLLPDTGGVLR
jgi:hypothetical protein